MNTESQTMLFRSPLVRRSHHRGKQFRNKKENVAVKVKSGSSSKLAKNTNRGRWTKQERFAFLKGFRLFGKGKWKQIGKMIPSRTTIQVKTHAQMVLKRIEIGEDVFAELDFPGIFGRNTTSGKPHEITDDSSTDASTDASTDDDSCSDKNGRKLLCPESLQKLTQDASTPPDKEALNAAHILTTLQFERGASSKVYQIE